MNTLKQNKYKVIKQAISKELCNFVYDYFLLKRKVARTYFDKKYISPFNLDFGVWNDPQVPDTYSHYSDIVMETLLEKLLPLMKKETELELVPTYSYARIYKNGDILKRHKDRNSCEISTTLNLGGDKWSIYLDPTGNTNQKGLEINLDHGDMLIYYGCELEHWREKFNGENCCQVFLHYNNLKTFENDNKYDSRPHLGLNSDFKK